MKTLYFDCFSGISGDMTVGALLDLGIPHDAFRSEMDKLNLHGLSFGIERKTVHGITGTDFSVHEHSHDHGQHNHHHEHRHLKDILKIIDESGISGKAKAMSKKIFLELATAEARVHGADIDSIHFHEVGAIDSIADIIGAAVCIDLLGVDNVQSSALHDGKGWIDCAHGKIPVPVPAVMEMLKGSGIPLIQEDVGTELVTPTGMALVKSTASSFGEIPRMKIDRVGYGFGKRDTGRLNALRVLLGERESTHNAETIVLLETNIDDMTPEMLSFAAQKLFDSGALDVYITPIYMKKNRPAFMLTALTDPGKEAPVAACILKHTSTFGVRRKTTERYCLAREIVTVKTVLGDIRLKTAVLPDGSRKAAPEYEDCRMIAEKTGKPISEIYDAALEAYRKK
jgi:uncharacterized protein (TIGR00299 family) protein